MRERIASFVLVEAEQATTQVTKSVSRSTRGPLGAFKEWDVQHSTSENHAWVEVHRPPAAVIAGCGRRRPGS